jgi:hypothetical protein
VSGGNGYTKLTEEYQDQSYAPARFTYLSVAFAKEYVAATIKHPPEEWAEFQRWEMQQRLEREVRELKLALWLNKLEGYHGILREAIHVQVVAQRIIDEMVRRNE